MKILVLGAGGQIAKWVIEQLGTRDDVSLTLFLRDRRRLSVPVPRNARVVEGDVLNPDQLRAAVAGQDVVYANWRGTSIGRPRRSSKPCTARA